jgi:parallel beta-helix repeat protein
MRKKIICKALVFGIVLLFVGAGVVSALNENSIPNFKTMGLGNWLYVGGGGLDNYTRIQEAIDNASDGDTVYVFDDLSPYQENIRINKKILVTGENRETTIISGVTGQDHVVRINTKNAEINGFTIKGAAGGQDGVTVYQLKEDNIISNNIIKESSYGIYLQATSTRTTISDNIISNNDFQGIFCQGSDRNVITGNTISANGKFGISMELNSIQNWIIDNTIEDNFGGIQLTGSSKQNNISGNQILNNDMEGILIKGLLCTANEITNNNISGNKAGIKISSGGKNIITSNNVKDNSMKGISLSLSNDNIIEMNNFIGNRKNAGFVASFSTTWDSNYWDNWIGVKLDLPLFKKFPKVIRGIVMRNFDTNPQEEPYEI